MKRVYWFSFYGPQSPSVRYRGIQLFRYWADRSSDILVEFVYPGYSVPRIFQFIKALWSALWSNESRDLIVIQRVHSQFIYAHLLWILAMFKSNTIYDLDDADYLERPDRFILRFIKSCKAVTVGSHGLVQYASQWNDRVSLLTSPIEKTSVKPRKRNSTLRIGWIGFYGGDHQRIFETLVCPALIRLPFSVTLNLLGVQTDEDRTQLVNTFANTNVRVDIPVKTDWLNEQVIRSTIRSWDIGLATLWFSELHRCKSAFKLKQYMQMGVPVLATPWGENLSFLVNEKNGYFIHGKQHLIDRIIAIRNMSEKEYRCMSLHALMSCEAFSVEKYANDWETLWSGMAKRKKTSRQHVTF